MVEAKKTTKKATVKPVIASKTKQSSPKAEKVETVAKVDKKVTGSLTVEVFDVKGKAAGTFELPKEVFGAKINPVLMAQAVRVYLANQRLGSANTRSRGEVDGSTRKIYRQKGTGRARHGGIRAPIFVGGGVAHGPKVKDYELSLSKKMRKAAVLSALSQLAKDGKITVVSGWEKVEPKTKGVAAAFAGMGLAEKKALLVMPKHLENVFKAVRNINKAKVTAASQLTTYDILNAGTLVVMKEAVEVLGSVRQAQDKEGTK